MSASRAARRRFLLGGVLLAAAASLLALLPVTAASAHSALTGSNPEEGQVVTSMSGTFYVTANEDLLDVTGDASGFALQIVDADGLHFETQCPVVDGNELSTPAALGAGGAYQLRFQFVSGDGHPVSGAIAFTWEPPADFTPAVGTEVSACGGVAEEDEPSGTSDDSTAEAGDGSGDGSAQEGGGSEAPPPDSSFPIDVPTTWIGIGVVAAGAIITVIAVVVTRRRRGADRGSD